MINKLRMLKFWFIAFSVIAWNTLKGNSWHMARVDFHMGDDPDGLSIRKRLIAKRSVNSIDIYWQ